MKRLLLISFSVINQILMSTLSVAQPLSEGSIIGRVLDTETKIPIPDASVYITDFGQESAVKTLDDGTFVISGLSQGFRHVTASAIGYESYTLFCVKILDGKASEIVLLLDKIPVAGAPLVDPQLAWGRQPKAVTAVLTSLTGNVMDFESDESLPFATIQLEQDGQIVQSTTSDFSGAYQLTNVRTGRYDVSVSYLGYEKELIVGMEVLLGKQNKLDILMCRMINLLEQVIVEEESVPLVERNREYGCCSACAYCYPSSPYCYHRKDWVLAEEEVEDQSDSVFEAEDLPKPPTLTLYPIPASEMVTVEVSETLNENTPIQILDKMGKVVIELVVGGVEKFSIPIDQLLSGVYILSTKLDGQKIAERFIVAK